MVWILSQTKGRLIFWGDSGLSQDNLVATFTPIKLTDKEYLKSFADSLKAHTKCTIPFIIDARTFTEGEDTPGTDANIDAKAIIKFRDPADGLVHNFTYPAPVAADIEDVGYGLKIKDSVVVAIVGYLNLLTGSGFIPLYGVYYQRV